MTRRGAPDYRNPAYETAAGQPDTAAIDNRLSGFGTLDQKGRILFHETFGHGLGAWEIGSGGVGIDPRLVSSRINGAAAYVAPVSVALDVGGGTNPNADTSYITRALFLGQSSRLGLEFAVGMHDTCALIEAEIEYFPVGGTAKRAIVGIYPNGTIDIPHAGGNYVPETIDLNSSVIWLPVKIVADFGELALVRVLVGETVYDVSSLLLPTSTLTQEGRASFTLKARGSAGWTANTHIGAVIATRDEP